MANNLIYPFGQNASGNNILTDANYQSDNQRLIGNQPGIARQELVNKALRNDSVVAAALAQFIADNQGTDVHDSLTPTTLAGMLDAALDNALGVGAQAISTTTTLVDADAGLIEADASGGSITITLPSASAGGIAFRFARTDASTNTVTIAAVAGETIEGATSITLSPSDRVTLVADGATAWRALWSRNKAVVTKNESSAYATRKDVTSSRSFNTTYTNSSGRLKIITLLLSAPNSGDSYFDFYVNSADAIQHHFYATKAGNYFGFESSVLPGETYSFSHITNTNIQNWKETF